MFLPAALRSAIEILSHYHGDIPVAHWLKNYFREYKKFGSRDRKIVADLCFCYFRLGRAFEEKPMEERLLIGQFLCHTDSPFIKEAKPEWAQQASLSVPEKIAFLDGAKPHSFFPFPAQISSEINAKSFELSLLEQPDLFLRLRPGKEQVVLQKLKASGIAFVQDGALLRLSNKVKADQVLMLDAEAVVQDRSSQQVLEPLANRLPKTKFSAWDCCAASGGKSILLHDHYPQAGLMVSDIRESIIANLRTRFKRAGIANYRSFVGDIASPQFTLKEKFDLIICDVPCSGSGTWGRTPEQLVFFKEEKIAEYAALQKKIALAAGRFLKPQGFFLYITCSVFAAENEAVVHYLQQQSDWQVLSQQYFCGWNQKGDTLFAALFTT